MNTLQSVPDEFSGAITTLRPRLLVDTEQPSWVHRALPHLLTCFFSCLVLLVPRSRSQVEIAQRLADVFSQRSLNHSGGSGGSAEVLAGDVADVFQELVKRVESPRADASAMRALVDTGLARPAKRTIVVAGVDDMFLMMESTVQPLMELCRELNLPLILAVEGEKWDECSESMRKDSTPRDAVVLDTRVEPSMRAVEKILEGQAQILESFHAVRIPQRTICAAARAGRDEKGTSIPEKGSALLDLWAACTALNAERTVMPYADQSVSGVPKLCDLVTTLKMTVAGQDEAVREVAQQVCLGHRGFRLRDDRPASAVLLTGPTGTGKTLLGKSLADALGSTPLIRVDMAALGSDHLGATLLGAPPGYVGSQDSQGWLTTKIAKSPRCVLLLDEIDKAAPNVLMPLLIELLGSGTLTDYMGQVVDASGVDVVLTANIGATALTRPSSGFGVAEHPKYLVERAVREFFPPEVYNRLDAVVPMRPLDRSGMRLILDRALERLKWSLADGDYSLEVPSLVRKHLVGMSLEKADGARCLHRHVEQDLLLPLLALEPGHYRADIDGGSVMLRMV